MPIPGEREPGSLTSFAPTAEGRLRIIAGGPSTLDAATAADRRREGGGAPSQRRVRRNRLDRRIVDPRE
jgi:hypothetical protein